MKEKTIEDAIMEAASKQAIRLRMRKNKVISKKRLSKTYKIQGVCFLADTDIIIKIISDHDKSKSNVLTWTKDAEYLLWVITNRIPGQTYKILKRLIQEYEEGKLND